jgi:hypothetical protein
VLINGFESKIISSGVSLRQRDGTSIKLQVKSWEEAIDWTRRFPNPAGHGKAAEIEVRQMFELEDFGESEEVERFRRIGVGTAD